ncbi:DMT family transporter [Methylorubrum salsuginis]|uniref:Permease of the drug/metabolite transporter (DMT) superfamily n=1 Tax=Methylorubrum salsuginis TaxID=414703 RepID=A0A1I3YGB2_9HYPH|nr:DMT family transporter [Methylorubrum salsuginis]SFK30835.1 Permease of the drug/metabolite transporter (DMT) superfamily [Methylorubrum salsuginis]
MQADSSRRRGSTATAYAILTLTALLWAGNAVAGKWAVGEVSPQVLTTLRWAFALALLAVIARRQVAADWPRLRARWRYVLLMGASGYTVFASLFYAAGAHTTALNVALIQGAVPIFVMLLNFLVRGAGVRGGQAVGAAVTLAGVAVASSHGDLGALLSLTFNRGDGLMLAACLVYAGYTVALPSRPKVSGLAFFTGLALAAFLSSLPPLAVEWAAGRSIWPSLPVGWPLVAFVALGPSLLAQLSYIRGVELIGPNRAGLFVNLVPVFGAGLAVLLAGEPFDVFDGLALALVLGGILIAETAGRRTAVTAAAR